MTIDEYHALSESLQTLTDTVTRTLRFGVAAANLVVGQAVTVSAVSGSSDARATLLGRTADLGAWERALAAATPWGGLRFADHRTPTIEGDALPSWVSRAGTADDPAHARPDEGTWHPDDALYVPLRDPDGQLLGVLSVDMPEDGRLPDDDTRRALEALGAVAVLAIRQAGVAAAALRHHRWFRAIFESSPMPMTVVGADRTMVEVNPAYCRFLGRPASELLGRPPSDFTHPDDRSLGRELSTRVRSTPQIDPADASVDKRFVLPDGSLVWGRLHVARLGGSDDGIVVQQIEDITARRRAEEQLRSRAERDAMTGLPTRAEVVRQLRRSIVDDTRRARVTGILVCDIEGLAWLNDTFGHSVGDRYLREVGRRLGTAVRGIDTIGRTGGDEFAVVAPGLLDAAEAAALAERLCDAVRTPWHNGPVAFGPSVTIGVACTDAGVVGADELFSRADAAMYRAKGTHRGGWAMWGDQSFTVTRPDLQLHSDLRSAVARGELVLHFQPVVDLPAGRLRGYEALLRWNHPRLGLLAPAQFLEVMLGSDCETPVTDWVITEAARRAAAAGSRVGVNVSSRQIARPELPDVIAAALATSGLAASDFGLELTEDSFLDHPDATARLSALAEVGIELAIDDFGSGYAGLQYLTRFPMLTCLKLDRAFTADLGVTDAAEHVVAATVRLAADCGMQLIVEGVETLAQAELLTSCGVPRVQGFYFGRPGPDMRAVPRPVPPVQLPA